MRTRLLAATFSVAIIATVAPVGAQAVEFKADVTWTEYGIPHIKANSWKDLGFGVGFAFAEQNLCVMAETFVTVNAERSMFFGPDGTYRSEANGVRPTNLQSDFFYQWINDSDVIEQLIDGTHPSGQPPVSQGVLDVSDGWVAGYNAYLDAIADGNPDELFVASCIDEPWVRKIDRMDLFRRYYQLIMLASKGALLPYIVDATPPGPDVLPPARFDEDAIDLDAIPSSENLGIGSNAYGLGSEATVSGNGMLLGNPHFPWRGPERFYQFHLQGSGPISDVNVQGGSLFGVPLINIGLTENVAWSHTVSVPYRFTTYELKLVPGDSTRYLHEGEILDMTETTVTVNVPDENGDPVPAQHTFYESIFGPVMHFPGALMYWTPLTAYSFRDANEDNFRALEHFFQVNQAQSVDDIASILKDLVGIPWVNTIAADSQGKALYADVSVVPHITDEQLQICTAPPIGHALFALARLPVLDGTRAECLPGSDPSGAPVGGIYGGESLPMLIRDDYVENSNDSYWLSNPEAPLEGYPEVMGSERTERSLRTRLGLKMIEQRLDGSDGEGAPGFTLENLQDTVFNNRQYAAELVRDALVEQVCVIPVGVSSDGNIVDLTEACEVLAAWDMRANLDSVGTHVFREFIRFGYGNGFFLVPFDADDPVNTPNTLNSINPQIRIALADAVERLEDGGVPLDAPLGTIQSAVRNGDTIPIHGGAEQGMFNYVSSPWDGSGYGDTVYGASFVITAELTPTGPIAEAILTYSQSTDAASPHFGDMTHLFSSKTWVPMYITENEVNGAKVRELSIEATG